MGQPSTRIFCIACCLFLLANAGLTVRPQSQALDAQIEGTVYDQQGGAISRARVIATNTSTGFARTVFTDQTGFYRMPLMPLGTYRIVAEPEGYTRAVREGVKLETGETATVDLIVRPGPIVDSVTVTADSPLVDPGDANSGDVLSARETSNLPLVSRNPLNFVFRQPYVSGRPNRGFLQFPVLAASGYRSRVSYHLDGNNVSDAGRAGVRLLVIPETFVQEVQFVANSFAPEFGNTPGVIMNMVTPSGSNDLRGSAAYLFRLPAFYSRPFGFTSSKKAEDSSVNDVALKLGAPLIVDRLHIFAGYEQYNKDDKGIPNRLLTITEANKNALIAGGLSPSIFPPAIPTRERGYFMLFRSDIQLHEKHRLAARFNHANIYIENNIQGGLNTLERSSDVENIDHAAAVQLASYSSSLVNELRFQFARRESSVPRNEFSGSGPSITIANVANFGSPEGTSILPWVDRTVQAQNNLTYLTGTHMWKFGGGVTIIRNVRVADIFARYTFPSIQAYLDAAGGSNPKSYTRYNESSGDPSVRLTGDAWNLFAQDDWKVTERLKLTFGVRYDAYMVPDGDPSAALPQSRRFRSDWNNFAPRIAGVYAIRQGEWATVLRVGGGVYYEQPWLDMYERALRQNGNPTYFSFTVSPDSGFAPDFPTIFPAGLELATQDIETVAPDREDLYAVHGNVRLEQAIGRNASISVGYFRSAGRHIPVYRSINYIPVRYLADGRPVFSQTVSAATRVDPRFNNILLAESAGTSRYDAFAVQFAARSLKGMNISASYTFSKAVDDAPEQNIAFPNNTSLFLAHPFDRAFDRGRSTGDQRHMFVASMVARPTFDLRSKWPNRVLNNNMLSIIATAHSGYAFNIVSTLDLNGDGFRHDRPLGIGRNSGTTPPLFNLDLRYSRFLPIRDPLAFEIFSEFTNVFNVNGIVQFNNVSVPTDINGELIGQLPDFRARNQATFQESRQVQMGIRFHF